MAIDVLYIPHGDDPLQWVVVDERNGTSYYPYVQGGPIEAAGMSILGEDVMVYVNSRYPQLDPSTANVRATALFEIGRVGFAGDWIQGDALMVGSAGAGDYETSVPRALADRFIAADSAR